MANYIRYSFYIDIYKIRKFFRWYFHKVLDGGSAALLIEYLAVHIILK
jgi:hypothetical protein